jgi:hypothetical protein
MYPPLQTHYIIAPDEETANRMADAVIDDHLAEQCKTGTKAHMIDIITYIGSVKDIRFAGKRR